MRLAFDPTTNKFDRANALYLAHASRIAYLDDPVAEANEILGVDATAFSDHLTNTQGFVGRNADCVVLAFRGTEPNQIADWITDFVFLQSSHSPYAGHVHDGFVGALAAAWPKVQDALNIGSAANLPLFVTGHSLGAALATLATCQLAGQFPLVATYTYGSPRVGDNTFCGAYKVPTYRIVNKLDLVPEVPLAGVAVHLPVNLPPFLQAWAERLDRAVADVPNYGHVQTFVYIAQDGSVTPNAAAVPWSKAAIAQALATRGKSYWEGINDHSILNYIAALH